MAAGYAGVAKVGITGSVTSTATERHASILKGAVSGASSSTMGTVPAGKKWTILGFCLSGTSNGGGTYDCQISKDETTKIIASIVMYSNATVQSAVSQEMVFPFENGYQFVAGDTVIIRGGHASGQCTAVVYYYEETA